MVTSVISEENKMEDDDEIEEGFTRMCNLVLLIL